MTDLNALVTERLAHNRWGMLGNQGLILGVDLGSYGLRAALVDLQHRTFQTETSQVEGDSPDQVVENAIDLARGLLSQSGADLSRLVRVGVGFGGPVDLRHGTVRFSPRVAGWENYPLQERFEQAFDAVTLIDNDANLIALGEATFGLDNGIQHLFYLHLSSGVGGGIVLNGKLYHGVNALAGEIGHAIVGRGWDGTGRPATLEELVSIGGLMRLARSHGLETNNLEDIFGESPAARAVVAETVTLLATRIAQIIALLDPEVIVIGGIVVRKGGDRFVAAIASQVNDFLAPQFARPVPVVASHLGPDSVTVGALALALESLAD